MTDEATFYQRAEGWLYRFLEREPVWATFEGEHRWDDRLSVRTPQALERGHRENLQALVEFRAMDPAAFGLDAQIDHELVVRILEAQVRAYEKLRAHWRSPSTYLDEAIEGVFLLIICQFAPLPERLSSALSRLREIPRALREGRTNIVPTEVPRVWVELALEQCQGGAGLFRHQLPALAAEAVPGLHPQFAAAGQTAAEAVEDFARFLEQEVLPRAEGDFAVGRELFDEMLREQHMAEYDGDQLLEIGWAQLRQTRAQMEAVAREIDPHKSAEEIMEEAKADHPGAGELLEVYRAEVAAIRQYLIDHEVVTIPEGESLRIVEAPAYLWPIMPYGGYQSPGILEARQEGLFLVTPVDPDASPEEQEGKLRSHPRAKVALMALHETYPGHHLQLVWANRREKIARRMGSLLANMFIEGWAFYCEELLEQLGYVAAPLQRLGRLSDQMWRAARIVLDVSLHTRGMSVEEAVRFLVQEAQMEPTDALVEVRRYTQTPTYQQCYLMGKLAMLELADDYRQTHPHATRREMHDAILGCGSLPPRLMRRQLGLA